MRQTKEPGVGSITQHSQQISNQTVRKTVRNACTTTRNQSQTSFPFSYFLSSILLSLRPVPLSVKIVFSSFSVFQTQEAPLHFWSTYHHLLQKTNTRSLLSEDYDTNQSRNLKKKRTTSSSLTGEYRVCFICVLSGIFSSLTSFMLPVFILYILV